MEQLKPEESFLDDEKELSLFDVVFPLFEMDINTKPLKLLGSCFPIGKGIYATAAHVFKIFTDVRNEYKPLDPQDRVMSLEEMLDRQEGLNKLQASMSFFDEKTNQLRHNVPCQKIEPNFSE